MTISPVKVHLWNINTSKCLIGFKVNENKYFNCFGKTEVRNGCFAKIKGDDIYIIFCVYKSVIIFDLNGNFISNIKYFDKELLDLIYYYYDENSSENYIIVSNDKYVVSFNLRKNKRYGLYINSAKTTNIIIHHNIFNTKLIAGGREEIRIWNFHTGQLLNSIGFPIKGCVPGYIGFWNEDYLLLGHFTIYIIDIYKKIAVRESYMLENFSSNVKKIVLPKYGECLISQSTLYDKNQIILWYNK